MELVRLRNIATVIQFPMIDADGDPITGLSASTNPVTVTVSTWADASAPLPFATLTTNNSRASENGSRGVYYMTMTAGEMNYDYIYVYATTSSTSAKPQNLLLRMTAALASLSSTTENEIADTTLRRDWNSVTDVALNSRNMWNALRFVRNYWAISGTTLTVREEDDTTTAWTAIISSTSGANPVTTVDPA